MSAEGNGPLLREIHTNMELNLMVELHGNGFKGSLKEQRDVVHFHTIMVTYKCRINKLTNKLKANHYT